MISRRRSTSLPTMNWRRQLAIMLAIASVTFAADAAKPKPASVQGSVSDAVKGTPLANAAITLTPLRRYTPLAPDDPAGLQAATSGPDGKFLMDEVPPGEYLLIARKNGYLDQTYGSKSNWKSGIPISVHPGDTVKDVSVSLLPGAVISGTIENEDGENFPNVTVRAMQYRYRWPSKKLTVVSSTTTNDRGEYRLHDLLPGAYYVVCSTSRERVIKEDGVSKPARYPVTFYPSVTTIETAVTTSVKAGDEAVVKVSLTAVKSYSIKGKVAGGDPNARLILAIKPLLASGAESQSFGVADDGSYEVKGLLPGDYQIMAMGPVRSRTGSGKRKVTVEDRDLNDVLITLETERPPIDGRIMSFGWVDKSFLRVTLEPSTSENDGDDEDSIMTLPPGTTKGSPVADKYGLFTAAELKHDAKTVFATVQPTASGFDDFYVAAVKFNGEDVTNTGFSPSRGGSLDIEYLNNGGRLEGTIAAGDGQTIPGATVVLVPDDSRRGRRDLYRLLRADQKGEFVIRGVAPGKYTILAWDGEIETDAIYDADYMKPYLNTSKAQSIEVTPRGKNFVVLGAITETTDIGAP